MFAVSAVFFCETMLWIVTWANDIRPPPPLVSTKLGLIIGKRLHYREQEVNAFLGIPYATPPLQQLRFRKPIPVRPWKNHLDATHFPPACPQFTEQPVPWYDGCPGHNENCLYLNVFVPTTKHSRHFTTMFWIHSGFYSFGSSRQDIYDGRALAITGNVIVVTINYRLGPLGFFYSNSTDAPGNMGILDQILALKWTRQNIEYFGGNKNDITIFGESVGAVSVAAFMISPLTRRLYKRAIMESFPFVQFQENNENINLLFGQNLAQALKCANESFSLRDHPHEVVNCLRSINVTTLVRTQYALQPIFSFTSQPTGEIFPENPIDAIRNAKFHPSELFLGFNADEGGSAVANAPQIFGTFGEKEPKLNKTFVSSLLREIPIKFNADEVIEYYFGDLGEYDYKEIKQRYFLAVSDIVFICPMTFYGEKFAERNKVYFYEFDHRPSNSPWDPEVGVTHFDEVAFVFGVPTRRTHEYHKNEVSLSERMMERWTSFAKYGYPDSTWPRFSKQSPMVSVWKTVNPNPQHIIPHLKNCNFLRKQLGF